MTLTPVDRRIAATLFAALWAVYALIGPGPSAVNPNSISRMGFVFSVLEDGVPSIDRFAPFTVDRAAFAGHAYMDKAPGLSLMALPVVAGLRVVAGRPAPIADGVLSPFFWLSIFVSTAFTVGLWTAAAAAGLFVLARRLGASPMAALFAASAYGLCTPAFGWATAFFSHGVTGALLLLGMAAGVFASDGGRGARRLALLTGALLGWAVVVEFTAGAAVLAILAGGLWRLRRLPAGEAWGLLGLACVAGVAAVVPLGVYNAWCFGSPFHLGYGDVVGFEEMRRGWFGITLPRLDIVEALLFGEKRGLFWVTPLLVVAPWGIAMAWRRWPREEVLVVAAVPLLLLLVNAGYAYWDGGASTGPRHLTPALPFLALALAPLWDGALVARRWLGGLWVISLLISALCAVVTMTSPMDVATPLRDYILPRFLGGEGHTVLWMVGVTGFVPLLLPVAIVWLAERRVMRLAGEAQS